MHACAHTCAPLPQQLKKLREQSEKDPQSAEKHAALLSELNKASPKEVISRVESKKVSAGGSSYSSSCSRPPPCIPLCAVHLPSNTSFPPHTHTHTHTHTRASTQYAAGSAVVAEYLRALVQTGKLADYTATGLPDRGEDHRSMSQLLREMQAQV